MSNEKAFGLSLFVSGLIALSAPEILARQLKPVVFEDVRVFDGTRTVPTTTVVVQDGIIKSIAPEVDPPEGAVLIDGRGKTLLPGLIDAHVHIIQPESLSQALVFGVTTELDMFMSHQLASAIRNGRTYKTMGQMSDFRTAGTVATSPGGHCTEYGLSIPTIDRPEKAQKFVDQRIAEGSDYIKVIYEGGGPKGVTKEVLSAVITAAHKRKKMAIVHISTSKAAEEAIAAGADGLAHVYSRGLDVGDLPGFLAEHNAFVISTLTIIESSCGLASGKTLAADKQLSALLSKDALSNLNASFPVKGRLRYSSEAIETAKNAVRLLKAVGVPILAGTDSPNPGTAHGVSLHRELELLVNSGLNPTEALMAATSTPAKIFGLMDRGYIAPGFRADLLLVTGNPVVDIKASRNIVGVWKQGQRINLPEYKANIAKATAGGESGKTPAPKASKSGLVSDFEQDPSQKPIAESGFGWSISTDSIMGGKSTVDMKVVKGGAQQSKQSLLITGNVAASQTVAWAGAMFSPGTSPFAPRNLSNKQVTFWAKGDGQLCRVMVYARHRGYMPAIKSFVPGNKWEQFAFSWKDFEGMDGSDITGIIFGRSPEPGKFQFQIDNVSLD